MGQYIVTDLTRFSNPDIVCIGVIDTDSGQCLRPKPYLKSAWVERHNVQPGTILAGKLALKSDAENPHIEDAEIMGGG